MESEDDEVGWSVLWMVMMEEEDDELSLWHLNQHVRKRRDFRTWHPERSSRSPLFLFDARQKGLKPPKREKKRKKKNKINRKRTDSKLTRGRRRRRIKWLKDIFKTGQCAPSFIITYVFDILFRVL